MTHTPSTAPTAADAPAASPGRSGHFPPLASQDELDGPRFPWWRVVNFWTACMAGIVVSLFFIIRALADWIATLLGAVL
jgi:hypothetical protein